MNTIGSDVLLSGDGGSLSFGLLGSRQGSEASLLEGRGVLEHWSNGSRHGRGQEGAGLTHISNTLLQTQRDETRRRDNLMSLNNYTSSPLVIILVT